MLRLPRFVQALLAEAINRLSVANVLFRRQIFAYRSSAGWARARDDDSRKSALLHRASPPICYKWSRKATSSARTASRVTSRYGSGVSS